VKPYELRQLFAMPLQAAVNAQALALHETLTFLEKVGMEKGSVRTFRLKTERLVEEEEVDAEGRPKLVPKTKQVELSIPLLALLPPPAMKLQEMDVVFGVEIVEPRSEKLELPGVVRAESLAPTLAFLSPPGAKNPTTMRVKMRIVNEQPEGMARLGDVLADMLSGREGGDDSAEEAGASSEQPGSLLEARVDMDLVRGVVRGAEKTEPEIEKVRGVGRATAAKLRSTGINTAGELVKLAEDREALKKVSKTLGIPDRQLLRLARRAKLLTEGEK